MENKKLEKAQLNYLSVEIKEGGESLIDLDDYDFILEPIYFKKNGWGEEKMYLRSEVANKLEKAQQRLLSGCKFKIFDAYRSIQTQKKIYDDYVKELKKENSELNDEELKKQAQEFVVFPELKKEAPPRHNTGGAVDLTIVNEKSEELDMGTAFDYFGKEASVKYFFQPDNCQEIDTEKIKEIIKNRHLLIETMEYVGFSVYPNEWWHWEMGTQFDSASRGFKYAKYGSADLLN